MTRLAGEVGTFRDPMGSLRLEGEEAVRQVRDTARVAVLTFLGSEFYARAKAKGEMVDTVVEDGAEGLVLRHPKIAVPSFPWEWTRSQWAAAAELTLSLGEEGLAEGWLLKDATPLNVLFQGSRPVFVDVLSFERYVPGTSLWTAYGQYVRTFLLPLLMHRVLHWPLSLSMFRRDGFEPEEVYRALSWRHRLSRAAFWPVTLPVWLERTERDEGGMQPVEARAASADGALRTLLGRLADLRGRVRRLEGAGGRSQWSEYKETSSHYTAKQAAEKMAWMREVLSELRPARVLDIGANTGEYSALAAQMGSVVVALERDEAAAERLFRMSRAGGLAIQTIHADLARPTPAVGWENGESASLLDRLEGGFDLVMMLALVHHLLLIDQIPLGRIVELCARLTRKFLVVEWVPAEDAMFRSLVRGREAMFKELCERDFLGACSGRLLVRRRFGLGNGRVLFLLEKGGG